MGVSEVAQVRQELAKIRGAEVVAGRKAQRMHDLCIIAAGVTMRDPRDSPETVARITRSIYDELQKVCP